MSPGVELPLWVEGIVSVLVVVGAATTLIGSVGLIRLRTFYERVHPPTMGATMGVGLVLAASMLLFSTLESRAVVHEIVIAAFMVLTTPVTYMLLMRAARHRDPDLAVEPEPAALADERAGRERLPADRSSIDRTAG